MDSNIPTFTKENATERGSHSLQFSELRCIRWAMFVLRNSATPKFPLSRSRGNSKFNPSSRSDYDCMTTAATAQDMLVACFHSVLACTSTLSNSID